MKLTQSQAVLDHDGNLIQGKWELDDKHDISYRTSGKNTETKLVAKIIDVQAGGLEILVSQKKSDTRVVGKTYRLKGDWRLDSKNRINFEVTRDKGTSDTLQFKNLWTLNKNNEVTYSYKEQMLQTKKKILRTLTFKGYWDIHEKNRFVYYLQHENPSKLTLRGAFQTKSILAKKDEIRYQFGIEVAKKIRTQNITLFGKWKYSQKLGLYFEVEYRNGIKKIIQFGGEYNFNHQNKIVVKLMTATGEKLGIELILSRAFLKLDGEAFVELFQSVHDSGIKIGMNFKW